MANKLDQCFNQLLYKIRTEGYNKQDRTGTGTLSIFGHLLEHNMKSGFPLLTSKKIFTKGVISEILWFLRGETNIQSLVKDGVNIWVGDVYKRYLSFDHYDELESRWVFNKAGIEKNDFNDPRTWSRHYTEKEFIELIKNNDEFAAVWGELGPIYGKQWRAWEKKDGTHIDQIDNIINLLKYNPDSRRIMVNAWNVGEIDEAVLPPCHYGFQFWSRELTFAERYDIYSERMKYRFDTADLKTPEKLDARGIPRRAISLEWEQRSVDTFLGLPFNIASYGFLLHIIGKIVNMQPEYLKGSLKDTHLYLNHIDQAIEQEQRENIYVLPELELIGEFENVNSYWIDGKFELDKFLSKLTVDDFEIVGYESHPTIKAPLSN